SLCWFCGCNVVINRNKAVSDPYLDHLRWEIDRVTSFIDPSREVVQFHWGGGTPTYLTPEQIAGLYRFTTDRVRFSADAELGLEEFQIFLSAIRKFTEAGYVFIGLDHFAKPGDELAIAQADRTLRRNFQGYSTKAGSDLYAMGVSAISRVGRAFAQNFRDTPR